MHSYLCLLRVVLLVVAVAVAGALAGCTGDGPSPAASALYHEQAAGPTQPPLTDFLPPLPDDAALPRVASAEVEQSKLGSETHSTSPGALPVATTLVLAPLAPSTLEWGVYQFPLGGNAALRFQVSTTVVSGFYWLAVGNFSTLSWELSGPFDLPLSQAHTLPSTDYASPGGNVYLAVIAAPFNETPADITVNSVTFVADDGTTPAFSVSGTITDLVSTDPLAGVTVTLEPSGEEQVTDSAGAFAFPDVLPGSYTLTPALTGYTFVPPSRDVEVIDSDVTGQDFSGSAQQMVFGEVREGGVTPVADVSVHLLSINANGSINAANYRMVTTDALGFYQFDSMVPGVYRLIPQKSGWIFSPNIVEFEFSSTASQGFTATAVSLPATVTYNDHMRPYLFEPVCMNCHASTKTGAQRNFAPVSVNWDTYGGTTEFSKTSGNGRVQADTMPAAALGFKTTAFQKSLFQAWLDGGFQEN